MALAGQVSGVVMSAETAAVSVVIPCYRSGTTIGRALASVAAQTRRPREVIIVDDGSDDDTPEILQRLQAIYGKDWVELIRLPANCGPGAARNTGWNASTQPYIAFLDADDSWHPRKIEVQLGVMERDPTLALTGHRWRWLSTSPQPDYSLPAQIQVSNLSARRLLVSNILSTPTVMVQRSIPFRFDPQKRHSEDYLLWLQILLEGYKAAFIHADLAYLYKPPYGASGLSAWLWKMEVGELNTYYRLWQDGKLTTVPFFASSILSITKFGKRLITSFFLRNLACKVLV